jgi:GNAT superfamily N-acetyltransferase
VKSQARVAKVLPERPKLGEMNRMDLVFRMAAADDAQQIRDFIVELATYEREPEAVEVSVDDLRAQLAEQPPPFECLIAELEGVAAGFALFFHNYSTWKGRRGLYLEDLFVSVPYRGKGIGKALLVELAKLAVERKCGRMEWAVLDWNTPAIEFYQSLGAKPLSDWTLFRVTGPTLEQLATLKSGS